MRSKYSEEKNKKFGRWSVIALFEDGGDDTKYLCLCSCGTVRDVFRQHLTRGMSKSCGCRPNRANYRHGYARQGVHRKGMYNSWSNMLNRCENPDHDKYGYYGARGITVCERWHTFSNFLADMGPRPAGKSIDRINNDGNYEPGNCRWATRSEQMKNRRPFRRKKV